MRIAALLMLTMSLAVLGFGVHVAAAGEPCTTSCSGSGGTDLVVVVPDPPTVTETVTETVRGDPVTITPDPVTVTADPVTVTADPVTITADPVTEVSTVTVTKDPVTVPTTVTDTSTVTSTVATTVTEPATTVPPTTVPPTTVPPTTVAQTTVAQTTVTSTVSLVAGDAGFEPLNALNQVTQTQRVTETARVTDTEPVGERLTSPAPTTIEVTRYSASTVNSMTGEVPAVTVSAAQVSPGGAVTLSGTGYTPGEQITLTLHSDPVLLETVAADDRGGFETTVTIPTGTPLGRHTIQIVGVTCKVETSVPLTVIGAPDAVDPPAGGYEGAGFTGKSLSYTGVDTATAGAVSAMLVGAGLLLLIVTRRRSVRSGQHRG